MFDLDAIYEDYLNLSYEEKVDNALESIGEITLFLKSLNYDEKQRIKFYFGLTALFVAADKDVSIAEVQLFNDVFGTTFDLDAFEELFQDASKPEFLQKMDSVIDKFPEPAKFAACVYGLIFLSIDGVITPKEKAVFEKILG